MKVLFALLLVSLSIGCMRSRNKELPLQAKDWHVDSKNMEFSSAPEEKGFDERFTKLYEAIRDHNWNAVYVMRTTGFRSTVSLDLFVKHANSLDYAFTGYEVLKQVEYSLPDKPLKKRFIIRFHVNGEEQYNVVWWIREGGVWNIENLGVEIAGFPLGISVGDVDEYSK